MYYMYMRRKSKVLAITWYLCRAKTLAYSCIGEESFWMGDFAKQCRNNSYRRDYHLRVLIELVILWIQLTNAKVKSRRSLRTNVRIVKQTYENKASLSL